MFIGFKIIKLPKRFDAETAKIASTNTKRSKFFEGIELQEQEPDITKVSVK